jgi:hypothetical protein
MNEDYGIDDYEDSGERTASELEDVHSTLREILSELKSRGGVLAAFWFVLFILWIGDWPGSKWDQWTDRAWYSFRYEADFKNITFEKRPLDCDFFHAPLGGKGCDYKKQTEVYGPKERNAMIQEATTPELKRMYEQLPNSVSVHWNKEED